MAMVGIAMVPYAMRSFTGLRPGDTTIEVTELDGGGRHACPHHGINIDHRTWGALPIIVRVMYRVGFLFD
jgi:hypothetical protein